MYGLAALSPLPRASNLALGSPAAQLAGGQESAGIASYDATGVHVHRGMGLVSQVFTEADIASLSGLSAIGHTRYSTAGGR